MEERQAIVWRGKTPDGLPIVVERDARERWTATVAGTMRSRHPSAAIAVAEATGLRTRHPWVLTIAALVVSRRGSLVAR
jgi:hypothetical protein